jgi:hypothetical protein
LGSIQARIQAHVNVLHRGGVEEVALTWEAVVEFLNENGLKPEELLLVTFSKNGYETWKIVTDDNGVPLEDHKGRPLLKTTKVPYES